MLNSHIDRPPIITAVTQNHGDGIKSRQVHNGGVQDRLFFLGLAFSSGFIFLTETFFSGGNVFAKDMAM